MLSLLRPNEARRQNQPFAGVSALLRTSAAPDIRTDRIGIELRHLIDAFSNAGHRLQKAADQKLAPHIEDILERIQAFSCRIAVVGQVKAGKSSFINALIQRGDLLPTHVNPWTAVATKLQFGMPGKPVTGSDFSFFSSEEWVGLGKGGEAVDKDFAEGLAEMKHRAEVRLGESFHHLLGKTHHYQTVQPAILQNYLCAGPAVSEISREIKPGRYADITKSANVYFPLPPFMMPATLIDTPGINDPTHLRLRITREIIEDADIYIVVVTARQLLSDSDLGLLELLRQLKRKRIIVFINRIDELDDKAGQTDVVIQHVKNELGRVFGDVSLPVVAGSAKWASFSASEDLALLLKEARAPSFETLAARRLNASLPQDRAPNDLAYLQQSFRFASGFGSVTKLLSLFMLSGFLSNHARGIVDVLLSAAEASAGRAQRQLRQTAHAIHETLQNAAPQQANAANWPKQLGEIGTILDHLEQRSRTLKDDSEAAVKLGIRNVETLLEQTIGTFGPPQEQRFEEPYVTDNNNAEQLIGTDSAAPEPERAPSQVAGAVDWLASVKEKTLELLRGAVSEQAADKRKEPVPTTTRRNSLTTPVTARRQSLSIDSQVSWWSEWFARQSAGAQEMHPAQQGEAAVSFQTGPNGSSPLSQRFAQIQELAPSAAIKELNQILRAVLGDLDRARLEQRVPADLAGQYGRTVADACFAIAMHESVTQQIRALFAPPNTFA